LTMASTSSLVMSLSTISMRPRIAHCKRIQARNQTSAM
jgi:hypothetical protein